MMEQQETEWKTQRLSTMLEGEYDYSRPRRGQVRHAIILSIGENEVVVDMGGKRDGLVRRTDLELLDESYRAGLEVGGRVPVCVMDPFGPQGELVVSLNQGLARQDWLRAQELLESEEICEAEVIDVNRGGVIVSFGRLRGFVPNSHLGLRRRYGEQLQQAKSALMGQTLALTVIEVDQQRRRLVLSQRLAKKGQRQQLLAQLTEGEVRAGTVSSLVDFGVFVDLGGIDGLIHISELDWQHVTHPREVLSVGDEMDVYVLSVDREKGRVGLSRKRLLPDPWSRVAEDLQVGQVVQGMVTSIAKFGVFVDLGQGVEGLVHLSEIPEEEGDWREWELHRPAVVRVVRIDPWRHRIALSLRDVTEAAPPIFTEEPAVVSTAVDVWEAQ